MRRDRKSKRSVLHSFFLATIAVACPDVAWSEDVRHFGPPGTIPSWVHQSNDHSASAGAMKVPDSADARLDRVRSRIDSRFRPVSHSVESVINGEECDTPSWQEAGTLFRWSFSEETGGPNLDEPLVTDRPDFTEASSTVGRGVAQLEFGYTFVYDSTGGVSTRTQSWGEPLLRYGFLADWLEFRIALFPVLQRTVQNGRRSHTSGTEDLYLGLKLGLTPQAGIAPEMALIPQMFVPTGSTAFTNDEVLPGVNWIYGWEINDWLSTAGSSQINRRIDDGTGRAYLEYAQSWTVAYTITEQLGAYTEWFALIPHSADTAQPQHYFNFGFTYLLSNDVQWDIRYGTGLNRAAEDYFIGTGFSIRFH